MAKVSLRVYNREIEGMIESGQLDEAVAHCQHILKTFPMHVETYRLLGKSYLEARRYTDAADIFNRALMAVPDDFVAHVGMSIIRDDEGKLDDAIWHMERAFEDQPSNPAIQGELRRLYGRRDGIEPPKIRLSRDALANMYSQGELFNQAIAEIRAVLAVDTNRPDLQVMLARAYFHAGQKVEAAEMAATLLKKYTYCMDALRILVDVLPGSTSAENTQVYRQRLSMLDPYSAFVTGSTFNTDQVADAAVNLEHLEYTAGVARAVPQPNWASSLGIKLTDEKHVEPAPDWMTTNSSAEQQPVVPPDSSGTPAAPTTSDKSIPDWMRTSGWQESSEKAQDVPVDFGAEKPVEPLAQADIPEWLKSMAPKEVTDAANAKSEPAPTNLPSPSEGENPDWLTEVGSPAADAKLKPSQPSTSPQDDGAFPDWLKEMDESASAGTAAAFDSDALEQPQTEELPASTQPATPPTADQAPVEPIVSAPRPDEPSFFQPTSESKPLKIEDDAMVRLESLAAKQGAKEEELLTKPENRSGEMPDWLQSAEEQPSTSVTPKPSTEPKETLPLEPLTPPTGEFVVHEPAPSEELPPPTAPAERTVQPLEIEDDAMAWLESLAAKQGAKEEELLTKPENRSEEMPDWLRAADKKPSTSVNPEPPPELKEILPLEPLIPPAGEFEVHEPAPAEELMPLTAPAEETTQPVKIEDDTVTWLEGVIAEQGTKEEDLLTKPENRSEEMPDWLRPADEQPSPSTTPKPSPEQKEDLSSEPLTPLARESATHKPTSQEEHPHLIYRIDGTTQPFDINDDMKAKLESLSTKEETTPEENLTNPDEHQETTPEWIQKTIQEPTLPEKPLTPETPQEDVSITSWLSKIDVEEALSKDQPTPEMIQPTAVPTNDLPDWLKELDKPLVPEETLKPAEDLPDWLRQPVQSADLEKSAKPEAKLESETDMSAWIDETIPASGPPTPTTPGEWVPMDEKPALGPEPEPIAEPASVAGEPPIQPQIPRGTGMLASVPVRDKDTELLAVAQAALDANQLNEAMQAYSKLIKKNRLLDEVIHDLREAIYRFPVDIIVWQTLGDAYMRANRLQDALDAYTKAEELLR